MDPVPPHQMSHLHVSRYLCCKRRFTFFTNWTFVLFGANSVLGVVLTGWFIQVLSVPHLQGTSSS